MCGRAYGTASIAIHLKQCKTRFLEEEAQKPSRERRPLPVRAWVGNFARRRLRSPPPPPPQPEPSSVDYSDASTFTTKNLEAANDAAFKAYNTAALFPCAHCGRTFLPHALTIHNRSCTADRPAKRPVGPPPAAGGGGGASGGEEEEFALPKRPVSAASRGSSAAGGGGGGGGATPARSRSALRGRRSGSAPRGALAGGSEGTRGGEGDDDAPGSTSQFPLGATGRVGAGFSPMAVPSMRVRVGGGGGGGGGLGDVDVVGPASAAPAAHLDHLAAADEQQLHEELASLNDRLEALQAHVCAEVGAITAGVSAVAAHLRRRGTLRA